MRLPEGPVFTAQQAVYVLHVPALGYYKIGRSENPERRVRQVQNGCPERVVLVGATQIDQSGLSAAKFEVALHQALFPYRSHGEWFAKLDLDAIHDAWASVWNKLCDESKLGESLDVSSFGG